MSESTSTSALVQFSDGLAAAVERAATYTVTVNARRRMPASGVLFEGGVVVTSDHAIEQDEEITVGMPSGATVAATIAGRDAGSDLAVLRIDGAPSVAAPRAADARVGNIVLAVGRPGSGGPVVSLGVVSSVSGPVRTGRGGQIDGFIRSDVTFYPGFSGGPLIDAAGAMFGVNTTGLSRGAGITLSYATVSRVAAALLQHGKIKRGFLGISSQPVRLPEALSAALEGQKSGLLIVGTETGGPADAGGLLVGDILIGLAAEPVRDTDDLQRLLTGERIGKPIPAAIVRGGERREVPITIGERA